MAITIRNKAQTVSTATNTITGIPAPLAGNILVSAFTQNGSLIQPTVADNLGSSGWTVLSTSATYGTTAVDSCWFAIKSAAIGTETTITWTVGTLGTAEGVDYYELVGASTTVDTIIGQATTGASVSTRTSATFTTTNAGSIILACCGQDGASGNINAWTGTPVLNNVGTVSSRIIGGSSIPGTTVSSTVTASWTNSNHAAILVLALAPPSAITPTFITYRPPWRS